MSAIAVSLLVVAPDSRLLEMLRVDAAARGYRLIGAASLAEALAAVQSEPVHVALIRVETGSEPGLDAIRQLKEASPDTEIIVVSATATLASAIRSYELAAFAFVQKPVAPAQLIATIDRALERRRITLHNRRLFWELQTINEIADGIGRSLELADVLDGALQRIARAFDAVAASIRLRDEVTGVYETRASIGTVRSQLPWSDGSVVARPSDRVIATRASYIVQDLAAEVAAGLGPKLRVRSVLSVPMLAGQELVGTVTVAAASACRFTYADERLLAIIAGQILVAVQNARLHDYVRRGKREWERTFDAIADPIAVFDSRGLLLRGNTALADLLGRPVTELRNATCREVGFCGGDCPECAISRALRHDLAGSAEITLPDGDIFSVTTFPVGGSVGASVVQVGKNVTAQIRSARQLQQMTDELAMTNAQLLAAVEQLKSTQAQLLQAEKLSAIGQLVAGVAHELNNPLTSVIGYAQLLEEELSSAGAQEQRSAHEVAEDLHRIAEESERAAKIVRNLLAFARRQTAARVPQDVTELCSRVLSLRTYDLRLNDIELATEFAEGLPDVIADGGQLQQALLNLILNAEQAMRHRRTRRLTVGARADKPSGTVEVFVADTGHGIDQTNLTRIFDPFFTTRDVGEGTGLGLSICYGIIRDHGGEIAVESQVDAGTRFSLRLPARLDGRRAPLDEVLLAHADQGEREFLAAALGAWGYGVASVSRVDEALARYRRGSLHAVFLDRAVLSANVAAWAAARADDIRNIPLVLLATAGSDEPIERFRREHASAVLAPPFQLRLLRSVIRQIEKHKEYV